MPVAKKNSEKYRWDSGNKDGRIDNTDSSMAFRKKENHRRKEQKEETMVWESIKEKSGFHITLKVVLIVRRRNQVR